MTSEGKVKVADATLSLPASESGLSHTTVMLDAVDTMSPEQARGEPSTEASDIYSLGVILYEMLTDAHPFEAADAWTMVQKQAEEAPSSPRERNGSVPAQLADIVMRMLEKRPERRFASAAALDSALAPLPQGDELLWLITPRYAFDAAEATGLRPRMEQAGRRLGARAQGLRRMLARGADARERLSFG